MHTYRGVFGAHVAHILRRLRRLCAGYGTNPQFLCCLATIANPVDLTQRLTGVDLPILVDNNGAPALGDTYRLRKGSRGKAFRRFLSTTEFPEEWASPRPLTRR